MKTTNHMLTINGGSSSIKFALYEAVKPLKRGRYGTMDRIGLSGTHLTFSDPTKKQPESRKLAPANHKSAANALIDWLEKQIDFASVKGVGHRVVHGMKHTEPEIVTQELLEELHRISPNDPDHLPREIELIETFRERHPKLPQVACFDTAFHQTMPRVAKLDHETQDMRAAEAVALFCYQAKKWIGSFAATLGGVDTLVVAGGIAENAPLVRARICEGLCFLGIELVNRTKGSRCWSNYLRTNR